MYSSVSINLIHTLSTGYQFITSLRKKTVTRKVVYTSTGNADCSIKAIPAPENLNMSVEIVSTAKNSMMKKKSSNQNC
jgi:hypothetical protein